MGKSEVEGCEKKFNSDFNNVFQKKKMEGPAEEETRATREKVSQRAEGRGNTPKKEGKGKAERKGRTEEPEAEQRNKEKEEGNERERGHVRMRQTETEEEWSEKTDREFEKKMDGNGRVEGIKPVGWEWNLRRKKIVQRTRRKAVKVTAILRDLLPSRTSHYLLLVCICLGMYAWAGGGMDCKGLEEIGTARISVAPTLGQQQQQQHGHGRGAATEGSSNNTEEVSVKEDM